MPSRVIVVEADTPEETEAVGRAIERVLEASWAGHGGVAPVVPRVVETVSGVAELGALPESGADSDDRDRGADAGQAEAGTATAPLVEVKPPARRAAPRARRKKPPATDGKFACPEVECGRSFATATGLGRHRLCAHGTPGSSSAARARAKARARGGQPAGKPTTGRKRRMAGGSRMEQEGLTPDAERMVTCKRCGKRVSSQGFGAHMLMHDRQREQGKPEAARTAGDSATAAAGALAGGERVRAPTAATTAGAPVTDGTPTRAGLNCPECSFLAADEHALAIHRNKMHGPEGAARRRLRYPGLRTLQPVGSSESATLGRGSGAGEEAEDDIETDPFGDQ